MKCISDKLMYLFAVWSILLMYHLAVSVMRVGVDEESRGDGFLVVDATRTAK